MFECFLNSYGEIGLLFGIALVFSFFLQIPLSFYVSLSNEFLEKGKFYKLVSGIMIVIWLIVCGGNYFPVEYRIHHFVEYVPTIIIIAVLCIIYGLLTWYIIYSKKYRTLSKIQRWIVSVFYFVSFFFSLFSFVLMC